MILNHKLNQDTFRQSVSELYNEVLIEIMLINVEYINALLIIQT